MIRRETLTHRFVETVPDALEDGVLYVSTKYATAVHCCCCGCGQEVVTPFSPTDWRMTFDGETLSLSPSIGNWSFPCRSHYWIERDQVRWARRWSAEQIRAGRDADRIAKDRYYTPDGRAFRGGGFRRAWSRVLRLLRLPQRARRP